MTSTFPRMGRLCLSSFLSPMGDGISKCPQELVEGVIVPAGCFEVSAQRRFYGAPFTPPNHLAGGVQDSTMVRLFDPLDPRLTLSTRVDESLDVEAGDPSI